MLIELVLDLTEPKLFFKPKMAKVVFVLIILISLLNVSFATSMTAGCNSSDPSRIATQSLNYESGKFSIKLLNRTGTDINLLSFNSQNQFIIETPPIGIINKSGTFNVSGNYPIETEQINEQIIINYSDSSGDKKEISINCQGPLYERGFDYALFISLLIIIGALVVLYQHFNKKKEILASKLILLVIVVIIIALIIILNNALSGR